MTHREPTPIDRLADDYTMSLAELDPLAATYLGISGFDDKMSDFSPAGHEAKAALAQDTLAKLASL